MLDAHAASSTELPPAHAAGLTRWWPALAAALLGAVIIGGVGFAPGLAHHAAHDTRHTMVFPCH